jgi:hypothetical protein
VQYDRIGQSRSHVHGDGISAGVRKIGSSPIVGIGDDGGGREADHLITDSSITAQRGHQGHATAASPECNHRS